MTTNGSELAPDRAAAIEQGLLYYHSTVEQRDRLQAEVAALKTDMAVLQVTVEGQTATINSMESRVQQAVLERDQAVRDHARLETVIDSISAVLQRTRDVARE